MSTTSADLPTETLGVVAHGAGDLRVESVPLAARRHRRPSSRSLTAASADPISTIGPMVPQVSRSCGHPCCSDTKWSARVLRRPMTAPDRQQVPGLRFTRRRRAATSRAPSRAPKSLFRLHLPRQCSTVPPHRRGLHPICRIARAHVAGSARRPAAAHCCGGRTGGGRLACRSPRRRHRGSQRAGRGQRTNRCPRRVSAATRRR